MAEAVTIKVKLVSTADTAIITLARRTRGR